ncbi:DUF1376 domain-containing protein [Candidatus Vondammii sp. HM_W22]|uniref:DUF1376 domain-containing protein n=1 Tax=Candidatus Vondammii sp. HM_W22 TaxID=2687299 RepID=UPI00403DFCD7
MHYYEFHIDDYRKNTSHLTPIEYYIYRELIGRYFLEEEPLKYDERNILRKMRLDSGTHASALRNVVDDFFNLNDGFLFHERIEKELTTYRDRSNKAKKSAEERCERIR